MRLAHLHQRLRHKAATILLVLWGVCAVDVVALAPAAAQIAPAAAETGGTPLLLAPEGQGRQHPSRRQRPRRVAIEAVTRTETIARETARPRRYRAARRQTSATEVALIKPPPEPSRPARDRHATRRHGDRRTLETAPAPAADATGARRAATADTGVLTLAAGSPGSTVASMAEDLAKLVEDGPVPIRLAADPIAGRSPVGFAARPDIDIALLQVDTLSGRGRPPGLAFLARLGNAEVHVLAGPQIADLRQLAGRRVAFDGDTDPAGVTGASLFARLGLKIVQVETALPDALARLKAGDVAAVVTISGKPAPALAGFDATSGYHLLPVPYAGTLQENWYPARLEAADYPGLVPEGTALETIATGTLLAVHEEAPGSARGRRLAALTQALFERFDQLRAAGRHAEWREVNLAADVPGWPRASAAREALAAPSQKPARRRADR